MHRTESKTSRALRIAVIWPRPRGQRWRLGLERPESNPDQSDALLLLEEHGFRVSIEDCTPFPLNPLAKMHEMWSGLDFARTLRLLSRYERYDAIVGVGDAVAFFLVQAKRLLGVTKPIVLIDPAISHNYPRRKRLQDQVLPYVDKVIVFGQVQLEYLREQYGGAVDAVYMPHRLDTDFYCPGDPQAANLSKPYVLSVGGDLSRDFPTLLRAIKVCQARGRSDVRCLIKTHLLLEDVPSAIEVIREPISWVKLRDMYRGASVVALPLKDSCHAGGINTLLEAMGAAKPIVVSNSRGIRDYVKDGESAVVVPPGDAEKMADAIIDLVDNPQRASTLGDAARTWAVENCDNRVYAARLAEILRTVVQGRRREMLSEANTDA